MWTVSLIIWIIAGITQLVSCIRGEEADWPSYWLCYGGYITALLCLIF